MNSISFPGVDNHITWDKNIAIDLKGWIRGKFQLIEHEVLICGIDKAQIPLSDVRRCDPTTLQCTMADDSGMLIEVVQGLDTLVGKMCE